MVDDASANIDLGLVTGVLEMSADIFNVAGRETQAIKIKIITVDGGRYSLCLTIEAAKSMICGIATWSPMMNFLLKQDCVTLQ